MRAAVLLLALGMGPTDALATEPALPLRINCGGDSLILSDGRTYSPDQPYDPERGYGHIGGEAYAPYRYLQIGGTEAPEIYLSEQVGSPCEYRIDLPPGDYVITLRLAAMRHHIGGVGSFDVSINSIPMACDLDLAARAPHCFAQDMRMLLDSGEGSIEIMSRAHTEIAGIEIEAADSATTAAYSLNLAARPRCGGIYLRWNQAVAAQTHTFLIERQHTAESSFEPLPRDPHLAPFYWDPTALPGEIYRYRVTPIDLWGRAGTSEETELVTPLALDGSELPTIHLTITPDDRYTLYAEPFEEHWVPAQIGTLGGRVRLRGGISREFQKKSFKFRCDDNRMLLDRSVFNLIWKADATYIREPLAAHLYRRAGIPVAECSFYHLVLNDETCGVYLRIEQIDAEFLAARGLDPEGSLYKVEGGDMRLPDAPEDYGLLYEKKTGHEEDLTELIECVERVNLTPDETFPIEIWETLDVTEYLDWYAIIALTANRDVMSRNHYYYLPPATGRWQIIPWDNDLSFPKYLSEYLPLDMGVVGSHPPVSGGTNQLITRLMSVPAFRYLYAEKLAQFLADLYQPALLSETADSLFALVKADGERDCLKYTWDDNAAFLDEMEAIHTFIAKRAPYVAAGLGEFRLPRADLRISELEVAPSGTARWCEIHNAGAIALATETLGLSDTPIPGRGAMLSPGTLAPGERYVVAFGTAPPGLVAHEILPLTEAGATRCLALWSAGEIIDLAAWPTYPCGQILQRGGPLDVWFPAQMPTPGWGDALTLTPGSAGSYLAVRPAEGQITIACVLSAAGNARLQLYDACGRTVRALREGWWNVGATTVTWDGTDRRGAAAPAGVYFLKLDAHSPASLRLLWVP